MPNDNTMQPTAQTPNPAGAGSVSDAVANATSNAMASAATEPTEPAIVDAPVDADLKNAVIEKISEANNILIALSSDPSVDELAAAIGLSLYLEKLDKQATAIYSGATPNFLEFLNPDDVLEDSVDILQDFVISLNKEKADHLRYKLDGDYVKVYITPYRTRIGENDLEFSYGDFNVDLVISLDVANGADLDDALREHGRIMHNASIINISTAKPGRFGEIEWSVHSASSISEILADLVFSFNAQVPVEKDEATAFLTGIIAATNRFSDITTAETMKVASQLMEAGANQQLITKNIGDNTQIRGMVLGGQNLKKKENADATLLEIEHEDDEEQIETASDEAGKEAEVAQTTMPESETSSEAGDLMNDLASAQEALNAAANEVVPEVKVEPYDVNNMTPQPRTVVMPTEETAVEAPANNDNTGLEPTVPEENFSNAVIPDTTIQDPANKQPMEPTQTIGDTKVIMPETDFENEQIGDGNRYGRMIEEALGSGANLATTVAPEVMAMPEVNNIPQMDYGAVNAASESAPVMGPNGTLETVVPANAEYVAPAENLPMPGAEILPPPPTPTVDFSTAQPPEVTTSQPVAETVLQPSPEAVPQLVEMAPVEAAPVVMDPVVQPEMNQMPEMPAVDPGAFKIPGM